MTSETDPWLRQFDQARRAYIVAWFHYARSQHAETPEAVLAIVQRVCARKLEWAATSSTEQLCRGVLAALAHQRALALSYARVVLDAEKETV